MSHILEDVVGGSKVKRVMRETWGHLRAKPGRHRGILIFACTEYGQPAVIRSDFEGVSGSPWYFQAEQEFVNRHAVDSASVYVFRGDYVRRKGDDCGRFEGDIRKIDPLMLLAI